MRIKKLNTGRSHRGLPWSLNDKEPFCQCRGHTRCWFSPQVWKIPWRRKWQSAPVFLPGKSHVQRSLEGYSPWGRKRVRHDWVTAQQTIVQPPVDRSVRTHHRGKASRSCPRVTQFISRAAGTQLSRVSLQPREHPLKTKGRVKVFCFAVFFFLFVCFYK